MAHIELTEGLPGIRGPMVFSPETTKPLGELVQVLLTGPHTLTPAEREMIATYVSSENDCYYCQTCHNRYVDGLATWAPTDPAMYRENGKRLAEKGYLETTDDLMAGADR